MPLVLKKHKFKYSPKVSLGDLRAIFFTLFL
jgi:hypothetical protein